jgi:hypothetical protein
MKKIFGRVRMGLIVFLVLGLVLSSFRRETTMISKNTIQVRYDKNRSGNGPDRRSEFVHGESPVHGLPLDQAYRGKPLYEGRMETEDPLDAGQSQSMGPGRDGKTGIGLS